MGSGTTLLRLMLDSHEHIAIPQETGFMRVYDAHRYTPFKASGRNWMKRLGWSDADRDELLREHFDRIFMRYASEHGKQRWGEKTPLHTWHIDDIARLFPDAQFIGMIRHPGASVASNMRRFRLLLRRSWTHWKRYSGEIARQAAVYGDRFAIVRYEDLVMDPEPVLRELLEWLGEPWSDVVLEHHEVQGTRKGRRRVEGRSRRDEPIDASRIATWKEAMRPDHQAWLSERGIQRSEFFGYDIREPVPVGPISEHGSGYVAYGPEIAERVARYDQINLGVQRHPPLYDTFYDPREVILLTREQFAWVTRPRGVRGVGASVVRRLPDRPRQMAVKTVRSTRAVFGKRRVPPKATVPTSVKARGALPVGSDIEDA